MAESGDPNEVVTLTRVGELTTAQLLCGRLEAEGIKCFLPDAYLTTQLQPASRGIRVQVRCADLERAQEVLAEPGLADPERTAAAGPDEVVPPGGAGGAEDDTGISAGDRAAFRSLRVALASLWLLGLLHPYSLWLAVRALSRDDVTAWGQRRAGIALLVSLAGCVGMVLLGYHLARLGR